MGGRWLLAMDDTDALGKKPGTGRLARMLAGELESWCGARSRAVIRQQLLVDPRVPYTSHNSPACIVLDAALDDGGADSLFSRGCAWLQERHAAGSDPGLCLVAADRVSAAVVRFGHRAATEVVGKAEALALAHADGVRLAELGGSGDGVIGALAAVGLTQEGTAGRFIELAGLRDIPEPVRAAELRDRGMVVVCAARDAEWVPDDAEITSGDWVRPRFVGGLPVVFVEPVDGQWRTVESKSRRGLGSMIVAKDAGHGEAE